MTKKFPEKLCPVCGAKMTRRPNSTIWYCPKCLIRNNKQKLKEAFSNKKPSRVLVNFSKSKKKNVSQKRSPIPWRDKPTSAMINYVQEKIINPYIRERDQVNFGKCISSNGRISDCGHYWAVGSYPGLRLHICNMHGQSRSSNSFKGGDQLHYRKGLIERHGEDYVKKLERYADDYRQHRHKWDRFSVIITVETYQYLHKNKIWVYDQDEFNDWKQKILLTRNK